LGGSAQWEIIVPKSTILIAKSRNLMMWYTETE